MTCVQLLDRFRGIDSIAAIRGTTEFRLLAETLPTDPRIYLNLAEEYLRPFGGDFRDVFDDPFERFTDILRELYYHEFRSLEALLFLCESALLDRRNTGLGMNETAAISNRLPPIGRGFSSDQELLRKIESFLPVRAMRHNARGIRQKILLRSPSVVMQLDRYPAT